MVLYGPDQTIRAHQCPNMAKHGPKLSPWFKYDNMWLNNGMIEIWRRHFSFCWFFLYTFVREIFFYKETLLPANLMYYSCLVTTANDLTLFTVQFWLGDDVLVFLFSKWCIPWVIGYQYASHLSISLLPNCPGLNGQSCAWQSPSLLPALFWSVADFHVLLYLKMI